MRTASSAGSSPPDCAKSGLVSPGSLGCAISHWTLWWKAIYEKKSLLILEDDVVTHGDILGWIERSELCRTADLVLFGINTDSVLEAVSPEGVHQISIFGETLSRTMTRLPARSRLTQASPTYGCGGCSPALANAATWSRRMAPARRWSRPSAAPARRDRACR